MSEKNQTTHRAPERLVNWLHRPGYEVELLVSRHDGQPLSDEDVARLVESMTAFEAADNEDTGPAFVPPGEEAA